MSDKLAPRSERRASWKEHAGDFKNWRLATHPNPCPSRLNRREYRRARAQFLREFREGAWVTAWGLAMRGMLRAAQPDWREWSWQGCKMPTLAPLPFSHFQVMSEEEASRLGVECMANAAAYAEGVLAEIISVPPAGRRWTFSDLGPTVAEREELASKEAREGMRFSWGQAKLLVKESA